MSKELFTIESKFGNKKDKFQVVAFVTNFNDALTKLDTLTNQYINQYVHNFSIRIKNNHSKVVYEYSYSS